METEPTVNSLSGALDEHREVLAPIQGTSARSNFATRRLPKPRHQCPHQQNNGLPPPPRHRPSVRAAIAEVWFQDDNAKQVDCSGSTTTSDNREHVVRKHHLQSIQEHFGIATEESVKELQGPRLRDVLLDLRDGGFQHNENRTQPCQRNAIVLLGQGTIAEKQEHLIELLECRTKHHEMQMTRQQCLEDCRQLGSATPRPVGV